MLYNPLTSNPKLPPPPPPPPPLPPPGEPPLTYLQLHHQPAHRNSKCSCDQYCFPVSCCLPASDYDYERSGFNQLNTDNNEITCANFKLFSLPLQLMQTPPSLRGHMMLASPNKTTTTPTAKPRLSLPLPLYLARRTVWEAPGHFRSG